MKFEGVVSKEFMGGLKEDFPNIVAGYLMLALGGGDKVVVISHQRRGKKVTLGFWTLREATLISFFSIFTSRPDTHSNGLNPPKSFF